VKNEPGQPPLGKENPPALLGNSISCQILDDAKQALSNAKVVLEFDGMPQAQKFTPPNGNGVVQFQDVPPKKMITIKAETVKYIGQITGTTEELAKGDNKVYTTIKESAIIKLSIVVNVVDEYANPISEAKLILKYRNEIKRKVITDQKGEVNLELVPEDEVVTIAAKKDNLYGSISGKSEDFSKRSPVVLTLKDTTTYVTISFKVKNAENDKPLKGAFITLVSKDQKYEGITSSNGIFKFNKILSYGMVGYSINKNGYEDFEQSTDLYINRSQEIVVKLKPIEKPAFVDFSLAVGKDYFNAEDLFIFKNNTIVKNGTLKGNTGFGLRADYTKCFYQSKKLEFDYGLGIGVSHAAADLTMDMITNAYTELDFYGVSCLRSDTGRFVKERISINSIDIPIFLNVKYKLKDIPIKHVYFRTGCLFSQSFNSITKPSLGIFESSLTYSTIAGPIVLEGNLLSNEYGIYNDQQIKKTSAELNMKTFSVTYVVSAGVCFALKKNLDFLAGLHYDKHIFKGNVKGGTDYRFTESQGKYTTPITQLKNLKTSFIGLDLSISYKL